MIANVMVMCRRPKRNEPETEPETYDYRWYWKKQTATTYAQRQIADTLM